MTKFTGHWLRIKQIILSFMVVKKLRFVLSNLAYFFIFSSFVFIFDSCNEKPTSIGIPLLIDTLTVLPFSSSQNKVFDRLRSFHNDLSLFNCGIVYIGQTTDTKAITMLRFIESNMPDSLSYLTPDQIISANLVLYPKKYTFGDYNTNYLSFKIYKVKDGQYWSNLTDWDSIYDATGNTNYFETTPIGRWSGLIAEVDNGDSLVIPFTDFSFIPNWIKKANDTSLGPIWGLALLPDASSNVIHQFGGSSISNPNLAPVIRIMYRNQNSGLPDSLNMYVAITSSFVKAPPLDSASMTIQGATSWRSQLFFDLSMLPQNASILKAQLELSYYPEKSLLGNLPVDTVLDAGLFLNDSVWKSPYITYYAAYDPNNIKYVFPKINSSLEYWLRHTKQGNLVVIPAGWNEYYRLDRITFHGIDDIDTTKRPKLIVIYSKRPY